MTQDSTRPPADLSGTADERSQQLAELDGIELTAAWLRRQLESTLHAWADEETELDITKESRVDY